MSFRFLGTMVLSFAIVAGPVAASEVGRQFPSERRVFADPVTGARIVALTSGEHSESKIYPTHPQWTHDGKHIVFRSATRAASGTPQAFVVNEQTGVITQITDDPAANPGTLNLLRLSNKAYYLRRDPTTLDGAQLVEIDLDALLADARAGNPRPDRYERVVATMPHDGTPSTGLAIDADERTAYISFDSVQPPARERGQPVPQIPSGIRSVNLATGETQVILRTPFKMGHIQANPITPGEVMYCHETGGDADQRMWLVKGDGTGNRPIYVEQPGDWVTHEQFADGDHVIFNLMGHTRDLRQRPSGLMVVSLRDGTVENLGQTDSAFVTRSELPFFTDPNIPQGETNAGGYWHNAVTYDRKWAAGDDFDGSVHLINRVTSERTMLTTGHRMRPDHAHPSFSPDGKRILLQSGMLTDGERLSLMVVDVPQD